MTSKKNVVTVTILGGEYTLRTETSPEHAKAGGAFPGCPSVYFTSP
jgi:hypothetical protein